MMPVVMMLQSLLACRAPPARHAPIGDAAIGTDGRGTMTLVFGCDVPDGTGMTLEYVSGGTLHTVRGEFRDGECIVELDEVAYKGITEIYGNVDYHGDGDLEMTVHTVDREGGRKEAW